MFEFDTNLLWEAFEDGRAISTSRGDVKMHCVDAGVVALPTGRLVVCDIRFDTVTPRQTFRVEPDCYQLFISMTVTHEVALTMIQFSQIQPTSWTRANPFTFTTDSGTSCLLDAKLLAKLRRLSERGHFDKYWDQMETEMEENDGLWSLTKLNDDPFANALLIRTMGGDGTFASYLGKSDAGDIVCFTTDYFLSDHATERTG